MESRRQRPASTQGLKKKTKAKSATPPWSLPNIAELIEDGEITIGILRPIGCVATAADEDCTYAMLVHRRRESFVPLLSRLDQAIEKALTLGIFTDEINR
jgi:acetylglutamate kinase